MANAKRNFLHSALFHALHGESATRNTKLKLLDDLCRLRDGDTSGDGSGAEDTSMTPVVDEGELLEMAEYSLRDYVPQAEAEFQKALRDLAQVVDKHVPKDDTVGSVGTTQDAQ